MKPPPTAPITFHKHRPRGDPTITVTPAAARQIRVAAAASDSERLALRIAARRDANGSIDYRMGFDNARKGDRALESEGVDLVVDGEHGELLDGMTLDYVEYEPGDFRFIFINPNDRSDKPDDSGDNAGNPP
jgi:iron-sulfur cluster assembly protein